MTDTAILPGWIQTIAHFTPTFCGVDALEAAILSSRPTTWAGTWRSWC